MQRRNTSIAAQRRASGEYNVIRMRPCRDVGWAICRPCYSPIQESGGLRKQLCGGYLNAEISYILLEDLLYRGLTEGVCSLNHQNGNLSSYGSTESVLAGSVAGIIHRRKNPRTGFCYSYIERTHLGINIYRS